MKKIFFKLICAFLCAITAFSLIGCSGNGADKNNEAADKSLTLGVTLNGQKEYVNPFIYGQFVEHIEDGVYDGIWAEMVLDRKFYYPIGKTGLSPWIAIDGDKVESDTSVTLSGGHSAKIKAGGGIYQNKLSVLKKDYSGYFWANSQAGCKVKISVSYQNNGVDTVVTVPANSGFERYTYSLSSDFNAYGYVEYSFEVVEGEGYFDSLSLMPADNYKGMRRDTLEVLKDLNSPLYRWPGGNFLSGWDWKDGVGNVDERPSRRNLHYMGLESSFASEEAMLTSDIIKLNQLGFYGGIEPNDFGLDEFMAMCEYLDTEPLMMVNTGLGSLEDAVDMVEYCNGSTSTKYGAQRAENGHDAPYEIEYWGVGNEMFGGWQLGHVSADVYVKRHNAFVDAMRQKDPTIKIVASGENSSSWSGNLFKSCGDRMDYIAEHAYPQRDDVDVFQHLKNMKNNMEGRVNNHRALIAKYPQYGDVKIAFTEYSYANAVCPSRMKDGLGMAVFLNVMINNADVFEMACYSSTVNTTQGCVTTEADGAVLQGAGYVLKLYHDYMQDYKIHSAIRYNEQLQLDVSATVSGDGKTLTIAVVNPSEYSVELSNKLFSNAKSIERHTFTGDYLDSYNSVQKQEMYILHADNLANAVAPAMSASVFVVEL